MPTEVPTGNTAPSFLTQENGEKIAYHYTPGTGPGVVFLHGLMSDMDGGKALAVEDYCKKRGNSFLRFDFLDFAFLELDLDFFFLLCFFIRFSFSFIRLWVDLF